ncbi:hypothetical protein VNO77_02478 [Canavalia gladiata]|uniref:Uncharacterized protein n=1 Tax=Canavalia gladiata TaxID=3824 RepID=A0AAN9R5Z4_CANGL
MHQSLCISTLPLHSLTCKEAARPCSGSLKLGPLWISTDHQSPQLSELGSRGGEREKFDREKTYGWFDILTSFSRNVGGKDPRSNTPCMAVRAPPKIRLLYPCFFKCRNQP